MDGDGLSKWDGRVEIKDSWDVSGEDESFAKEGGGLYVNVYHPLLFAY